MWRWEVPERKLLGDAIRKAQGCVTLLWQKAGERLAAVLSNMLDRMVAKLPGDMVAGSDLKFTPVDLRTTSSVETDESY